jgi:peptidyl-prolyl cis-trans isomerase C
MKRYTFFVSILCLAVITVIGCDAPKKKVQPKKAAAQAAPVATPAAAPVAQATEAGKPEAVQPLPAGVLVKVGDWSLTKDEFNDRIKSVKAMVKDFNDKDANAKAMLLNELVRQQLLIQEARKQKLQDTKEVQAALKDFENTVLVQEVVGRLTKDLVATDDEVKKYYDENPAEFKKPIEKKLREIVVGTQAEANDILVQVLQGGDFAQVAKEKSKAATKDNGGDLGFKTEAPFAAMAAASSTLKKGGISAVFEGPEGYYIVKVEDIRGGDVVTFDEVKKDLAKFLTLRKQQQAVAEKIKDITKEVKVQVNEDLLKEGTGE